MNDLVGRCIAEQEYSSAAYAVTLTYGGDEAGSAVLVYADFQRFMKRLRRRGFRVRYIVAGEYGSKKGRAHWHAVLFFQGKAPEVADNPGDPGPWEIVLDRRINWEPWPHGFAFFQQPDYGGFAYVLKYALKDLSQQVRTGHLAMSKKPPLGADFVADLAERYVRQHLAPQDLFYSFPHVFDANHKRRRFMLQGKSRENFISAFIERWEATHGVPHPVSDVLMAHWDKIAAEEMERETPDEVALARKAQWPRYASEGSSGSWVPDQAERDFANWQYWRAVRARLPFALIDVAPLDLVEASLSDLDVASPLWVFDPPGDDLQIFYPTETGEKRWLVNDTETAEQVRAWLRQVSAQSARGEFWTPLPSSRDGAQASS